MKKIMLFLLLFTLVFSISFAQLAGILSQYGNYIFLGAFCALIAMICQISLSRIDPRYGNIGILLGVIIFIYLMINPVMGNTVLTFIAPYTAIIIGIAAIYILINLFRTVGTHHGNWGKMIFGIGLAIVTAYAANILMQYIPPTIGYARMIFNIIIAFGALLFIWGLLGLVLPHVKAAAPSPITHERELRGLWDRLIGPTKSIVTAEKIEKKEEQEAKEVEKEIQKEYKIEMDAEHLTREIIELLRRKANPDAISDRIKNLEALIHDEEKRTGRILGIINVLSSEEGRLTQTITPFRQVWGKSTALKKVSPELDKRVKSSIMGELNKVEEILQKRVPYTTSRLKGYLNTIRANSAHISGLISQMRSHIQHVLGNRQREEFEHILEENYAAMLRFAEEALGILVNERAAIQQIYGEAAQLIEEMKVARDTLAKYQGEIGELKSRLKGGPDMSGLSGPTK